LCSSSREVAARAAADWLLCKAGQATALAPPPFAVYFRDIVVYFSWQGTFIHLTQSVGSCNGRILQKVVAGLAYRLIANRPGLCVPHQTAVHRQDLMRQDLPRVLISILTLAILRVVTGAADSGSHHRFAMVIFGAYSTTKRAVTLVLVKPALDTFSVERMLAWKPHNDIVVVFSVRWF
jgi:hypothetical protein